VGEDPEGERLIMALKVNLVSAEAEIWSGEASLVVAKTVEGEMGIMTGHEPVLAILAKGEVRITELDGTKVLANAQDGFLSMEGDELTIVAGNAALIA
jgi:F-type H+-transporting ATPase subunit epsilon